MHRTIPRIMATGIVAAGLPLSLLTSAGAASAATATASTVSATRDVAAVRGHEQPLCVPSPYTDRCNSPTVQGTPFSPTGDFIRHDPTAKSADLGGLPPGVYTTVFCFSVGQSQSGPGSSSPDDYWDFVDYNGISGFISDAWLNTSGAITSQVPVCVSGLH